MMYSLNEIGLIPKIQSSIISRSSVYPYIDGKLPIFVAPMTCIINSDNFETFNNSKVIPILPVTKESLHTLPLIIEWQALTLADFSYFFNGGNAVKDFPYHILIDCANGHMESLYSSVKDAKKEYPDLVVMIGNIANPKTYLECCKTGVDYVRVGIGGGSGCTTSTQTGIHASMVWLLTEISKLKVTITTPSINGYGFKTKVIADGGIDRIDKAIKCLALGADYVMMGKCFAQCRESCGELNLHNNKHYYGQSSEQGQIDRFGKVKSSPEGCSQWIPVTGTLEDFTNKFESALRSAMSYAGASTLNEFIGNVETEVMSLEEFSSYYYK